MVITKTPNCCEIGSFGSGVRLANVGPSGVVAIVLVQKHLSEQPIRRFVFGGINKSRFLPAFNDRLNRQGEKVT